MRSSRGLQRLTANAKVGTVLGSIPATSDTAESEGLQMKQCQQKHKNIKAEMIEKKKYFQKSSCEEARVVFYTTAFCSVSNSAHVFWLSIS
jgi:hypothetical protein